MRLLYSRIANTRTVYYSTEFAYSREIKHFLLLSVVHMGCGAHTGIFSVFCSTGRRVRELIALVDRSLIRLKTRMLVQKLAYCFTGNSQPIISMLKTETLHLCILVFPLLSGTILLLRNSPTCVSQL